MAAVKTLSRTIVDALGVPLVGKVAVLKNNATGATITSGATDANGVYSFPNIEESVRYRVEVSPGGASTQVYRASPADAEFGHLYAMDSLRVAAGAVVSFPTAANVFVAGQTLDARYVNTDGDTMTGGLAVQATTEAVLSLAGNHVANAYLQVLHTSMGAGWLVGQASAAGPGAAAPSGGFFINQSGVGTMLSMRTADGRIAIGGQALAGGTAQVDIKPTTATTVPLAVRAHASAVNSVPHLVTYTQTGVLAMGFNRYGLVVGSSVCDTGITPGAKKAVIQVYDETGTFYGYITITQ